MLRAEKKAVKSKGDSNRLRLWALNRATRRFSLTASRAFLPSSSLFVFAAAAATTSTEETFKSATATRSSIIPRGLARATARDSTDAPLTSMPANGCDDGPLQKAVAATCDGATSIWFCEFVVVAEGSEVRIVAPDE